ncbi:(2Fe-2S)-binding protein [Caballeronia sordidicola]|uniref:(2Fe-2S)-binding protein n=1 Tax=Caballeronia sordidicola TaxID=196367 RepID=A0A158G9T0_CABSO|nr:2Fe-2S iron-sulfur cluster-binding protein [Caballeronia sordidicola]SAL28796.1 (2Fe-2S)-binding protein [Caballeronia sordidicola]
MSARSFTITLLPSNQDFPSTDGTTILEAASLAGLRLPSSCRNGTCRACLCQLKNGEVRYKIEWPGLTTEEKAEGWILPCVAIPASNVEIEADFEEIPPLAELKPGRGRGF